MIRVVQLVLATNYFSFANMTFAGRGFAYLYFCLSLCVVPQRITDALLSGATSLVCVLSCEKKHHKSSNPNPHSFCTKYLNKCYGHLSTEVL